MGACSSKEDFKHATSSLLPNGIMGTGGCGVGYYDGGRGGSSSYQWNSSDYATYHLPTASGNSALFDDQRCAKLFDSDSSRWEVVATPAVTAATVNTVIPTSHNLHLHELTHEAETGTATAASSSAMKLNNGVLWPPPPIPDSLLVNKIDVDSMDLQAMPHISYLEATELHHLDSARHQQYGNCNVSSPIMERAWSSPISPLSSRNLLRPVAADHHSLTSSSTRSINSSCLENLDRYLPRPVVEDRSSKKRIASDLRSKRRGLVLPAPEPTSKLHSLTTSSFRTQDYYFDCHPTDCSADQYDNSTIITTLSPDSSSPVMLNKEQKKKKRKEKKKQQHQKVFLGRKFSCAGWSICADTEVLNSTVNPPLSVRSSVAISSGDHLCESCRRSPIAANVGAAPSSLLLNKVNSSASWLQSRFKLGGGSARSTVNSSGKCYIEESFRTSATSEILTQQPAMKGKTKHRKAAAASTHISSYSHPRYRKATTPLASFCKSPALQHQLRVRRSNAVPNGLLSRCDESTNTINDNLEVSQRRRAKHRTQRQSRRTRFMRGSSFCKLTADGYASLFSSANTSPLNMDTVLSHNCEFDRRNNPYPGLFSPHPQLSAKPSSLHDDTHGQPAQLVEEVDRLSFRFLDGCSTNAMPIKQSNTHTQPRSQPHRRDSFTFPNLALHHDDDKSAEKSIRLHEILSSDSEGADLEEESTSSDEFDAALAYYKSSDIAEPSFSSSSGTVNDGSSLLHTTSYTTTSDNDYYPSRAQGNSMRKQNFIPKHSRGGSRVVSKLRRDRLVEPNSRPSTSSRKTRDGAFINGFSYPPVRASRDQRADFLDCSKVRLTTATATRVASRSSSPSIVKKLQTKADSALAYNNDSGRRSYSHHRHCEVELPPSKQALRAERRAEKMTPARESNRFRR